MALRAVLAVLVVDAAFLAWAFYIAEQLRIGGPVLEILAATACCIAFAAALAAHIKGREG